MNVVKAPNKPLFHLAAVGLLAIKVPICLVDMLCVRDFSIQEKI